MRTLQRSIHFLKHPLAVHFLTMLALLAGLQQAVAQPTVSVVPANFATGVSPGAPVVFTFSTAMNTDPDVTSAQFYSGGATPAPVVSVWSAGNTVLTCTPSRSEERRVGNECR